MADGGDGTAPSTEALGWIERGVGGAYRGRAPSKVWAVPCPDAFAIRPSVHVMPREAGRPHGERARSGFRTLRR